MAQRILDLHPKQAALAGCTEEGRARRPRVSWRTWAGRNSLVVVGAFILALAAVVAIAAPLLTPMDPLRPDLLGRLKPPLYQSPGGVVHLLGTDNLGRDILARTVYGARISMIIGFFSVFGAGLAGVLVGLIAGYYGGIVDEAIMLVADIQQSFPYLALALALVAVLGAGLLNLILVLCATGWILYARVVRAEVLSVRQMDYVQAARATGASTMRIILRHVLPNVQSPILIIATFNFAYMIIAEASLTFLGAGVDPAIPSWGNMLSESRNYLAVAWWFPAVPGVALMLTVMGANLLGDGLRDLWDPRLQFDR